MRLLASLLLVALGCGAEQRAIRQASGDPEPVVRPDPTRDGPKPEHLEVVAMTVRVGDDTIFIKADGGIERKGEDGRLATLRKTGELLHANGALMLTLNRDGTITGSRGEANEFESLTIGQEGDLIDAEKVIASINETGDVTRNGQVIAQISGEGGRRAAMLVLLVYFPEDGDEKPADGDEKPADADPATTPDAALPAPPDQPSS